MNYPEKILIIRLSSLGDILHTLPAYFDLRYSFPDAEIDWLVGAESAFLLSTVRGIDTVHVFDRTSVLPGRSVSGHGRSVWGLIRALRRKKYDFTIDFQGLLKTALLGSLSGAAEKVGFPAKLVREKPAHWFYNRTASVPQQPVHVLALNRLLAGCAGAQPFSVPFEPVVPVEDRQHVESLLAREKLSEFIVINPGGGWKSKIWKPEHYGRLADRIRNEKNTPVVVTTGPGEESLYEELSAHCGGPPPVHFRVSFIQLIPLLKKARLLIGGDTGPFHLACALSVPVVGIFGPTSTVRNGPWRKEDGCVAKRIDCSDCYKRECPTGNACMDIPVDDVFEAVTRRLENIDSPDSA